MRSTHAAAAHRLSDRQYPAIPVLLPLPGRAQSSLTLPPRCATSYNTCSFSSSAGGLWAGRSVRFYLEMKQLERGADQVFAGSLDIINFVSRMLIWSLLILVALDNLGSISPPCSRAWAWRCGRSSGLQNILASVRLALDRLGQALRRRDTLVIDVFTGKVEHIGIKTTRLRSDTGEQIILSNADILKSRVRNFGRAQEQRALATIRVTYDTAADKLQGIPALLEGSSAASRIPASSAAI